MKYLVINCRSYCYQYMYYKLTWVQQPSEKNSTVGSFALFYHKLKAYLRVKKKTIALHMPSTIYWRSNQIK